ncbi:hypothetical protein U9J35_06395 [Rossellomorea aquimaris]|nr:hypothetical protein [Rossellomorea aquimaris]WRP07796.1 hypothetical protein U9J35_06395 [Rossellomorea aquimaris]
MSWFLRKGLIEDEGVKMNKKVEETSQETSVPVSNDLFTLKQ